MGVITINYNGKEYTLEEINLKTREFEKELVIPDEFQVGISVTDLGRAIDTGYAVSGLRFRDLHSVIVTGRYAIVNAYKKMHSFGISWNKGSIGQLWLRAMYLKNAILWYNSCEDYILQIIWFAFDFCDEDYDLEIKMKKCNYQSIKKVLNQKATDKNASILLKELISFHDDPSLRKLRKLSNDIKHKQLLRIRGLDDDYGIEVVVKNKNKPNNRPELYDIDNLIDIVAVSHKKIVLFGQFLYDFIDFNKMFSGRDNNILNLAKPRKREEFKKIIIKS